MKKILIYIALGLLCAAPSIICTFRLKFKKIKYPIEFSLLYAVVCVLGTCYMGVAVGAIMGAVCGYFTYRNYQKYKETMAKRNRENYKKIKQAEYETQTSYDEHKAEQVWPPVDKEGIDFSAAEEFWESEKNSAEETSDENNKD